MEKQILEIIKQKKLINPGETIGVAVSGGVDSMSLLHFLNAHKEELDCKIVAITIDHMLRGEDSLGDALFVKNFCKENKIPCQKFSVDALKLAKEKNIGVEQAAREVRYSVFDNMLKEHTVDKIALAHHLADQAETILLHILRGSGLNGACGMEHMRGSAYIRPFLNLSKEEISRYASKNGIEFVQDQTNFESKYNRNFLRNVILPKLKERWPAVEKNLVSFADSCREDNDFIFNHVSHNGVIVEKNLVKIPLIYFHYAPSVINRILFDALEKIEVTCDIEKKHIEAIKSLADGENGKKINLPNILIAQKEYEYITIYKNEKKVVTNIYDFCVGKTNFCNLYEISVKSTKKFEPIENALIVDSGLVPKDSVWRTRQNKDIFTKFGGGSKSLKKYFIDKKIPSRIRDNLPVLASGSEILCVLGVEISDKIKVTDKTKKAYLISYKDIQTNKK